MIDRGCRDDSAFTNVIVTPDSELWHRAKNFTAIDTITHDHLVAAPTMIRTVAVAGQSSTKITGSKGSDLIRHTQLDRCVIKRGQRVIELVHECRMSIDLVTVSIVVADAHKKDLAFHSELLSSSNQMRHHP